MTPDERKQLRSEVKLVQQIQKANGEDVTGIHETERGIMERRKVEEALEKAQPTFLRDGNGLRGQQLPVAPIIDGADGWVNNFQVKRKRGAESAGGAAAASPADTAKVLLVTIVQDPGTGAFTQETVSVSGAIV